MSVLRFVLGDQLTRGLSSLRDLDPARDVVLMVEVAEEAGYVPHHRQKLVFVFSAMRHFAEVLRSEGVTVDYVSLDDPDNAGSFAGELSRAIARHRPERIVMTEPGEWRVLEMMTGFEAATGLPVAIRDDDRFFASRWRFAAWASGRRSYRMEWFYREMRRETGLLMDGDEPAGGAWNFDRENRSPLPKGYRAPSRRRFAPDAITRDVIRLVEARFPDNFGDVEPFGWAVTREDALCALAHFVDDCLAGFGGVQDAMKAGEPFLQHAVISPYLNVGLLTAREVCAAAEAAYRRDAVPINAAEGFIRQILGWREYVRGLYWLRMPDYVETNCLSAERPLPWFYWSGETPMACLAEAIGDIRRTGYGHHIQRLMVTGNFALLAGIRPADVDAWYLAVYVDAYEWVELPNVHGMALFADGGLLASKPYAASGAYIDRMSDYCAGCRYSPKIKSGPKACPFNLLYWDFLMRNESVLSGNPRMAMAYRTLAGFKAERRAEIRREATAFLDGLGNGPEPEPSDRQGRLDV